MLSIIFNRGTKDIEDENYVFSPDIYFKYNYEEEWFEDELVKEMVRDVDRICYYGDSSSFDLSCRNNGREPGDRGREAEAHYFF